MQLSLGEVAAILGVSRGTPAGQARGYSIDSRTLRPGELFFALRGPRFDGHDFLGQAFERGAVGAVVAAASRAKCPAGFAAALICVADTTQALQHLGREVRRKWGRRVVAITGSAGKSSTKEMLASLLARRFSVLKSPGNLNNHYGLPLALLGLEPAHQVAVVELAMSAPGEIARLARIAEPQVGVVTNVAPVHLEFFDSLEAIARAKRELIENLSAPAIAVLNYDDARVRSFAEGFAGRAVTFGFEEGAAFRAAELSTAPDGGSRFRVKSRNLDAEFRLAMPGRHNVQNALAAIASASLFDVPGNEMREALAGFQGLHQRAEILTLPGGVTVLNDSYNSNPLAMERMLETLATWPGARRRIVLAGEMLELGPTSPELHRQIGQKCASSGVDWLLAVQGDARFFLEGAADAGLPRDRQQFFPNAQEAGEHLLGLLRAGDVVLVKASRVVHLEKAIELLAGKSSRQSTVDSG